MAEIEMPDAPPEAEAGGGRRIPLLALPLLLAVLALAAYIGINVLSVLFAVVSPPAPPLPPNLIQTSHESPAYGVDFWRYTSSEDGCVLLRYLQANGGVCEAAPLQCSAPQGQQGMTQLDGIVGRCDGGSDFSIFTMRWTGRIIRQTETLTQLQLDREVYWLGTGPQ